MKKQSLAIAALACAAAPVLGQTYDNGGMDPRAGGCNGGSYSAIESPSTVFGNNTIVTAFHQADDFTVPSGQNWTPTQLTWYLYQSLSSPQEPITAAYIQLWRGSQSDMLGGTATLLGGDMTTNRLISSTFSNVYRVSAATPTNCDRAVKEVKIDMSWVGALSPGQYWIEIGSTGNPGFSGPWANHVVPRNGAENAIYYDVALQTWNANNSNGVTWDYPFKLAYTTGGGGYTCTITGTCPGQIRLSWSGAPANRQQGIVFARNTGNYQIPNGPCAGTRLGLGTNQLQLYNTISTGNGSGGVNATVNQGACRGYVQLVAVTTPCQTSNVAQVP